MTTPQGLLEYLAAQTHCSFLSDLHRPGLLPSIQYAVSQISPERYSLNEWADAIHYITGGKPAFQTPLQACAYLQNFCVNPTHYT